MGVGEMSRYTLVLMVFTIFLVFTDSVKAAPKAKTLLVETMGEPEAAPEPKPEKKCSDCQSKFKYTNEGKPGPIKEDYSDFVGDYSNGQKWIPGFPPGHPGTHGDYGLCPGHHTCYSDYNGDYIICPYLGHPTCFG